MKKAPLLQGRGWGGECGEAEQAGILRLDSPHPLPLP